MLRNDIDTELDKKASQAHRSPPKLCKRNLQFILSTQITVADMVLPVLLSEKFTFKAPASLDSKWPLKMAATRYTENRQSGDGITILLAHGTSTRKLLYQTFSCNR